MANSDAFWESDAGREKQPGVSEAVLDEWQNANGVQLPAVLREALLVQNGGLLRNSDTTIFGLDDIVRPDEEVFYELEDDEELSAEFEDQGLVFAFAEEVNDGLPMYLLNFNANGPAGEPSVLHYYRDIGDIEPEAGTVAEFIAAKQTSDSECAVDWAETGRLDPLLFRDRCEVPDFQGGGKRVVESYVGRLGGVLCVFKHEVSGDVESYLKLEVKEPLDPEELKIETIGSNPRVYCLRLCSLDEDDFDDEDDDELDDDFDLDDLDWDAEDDDGEDPDENRTESYRMKDGMWKNASGGALDDIESLSREKLEKLRLELLGEEGEKVARSAEALQAKAGQLAEQLAQKTESMTPEERVQAGMQIAKELGAFGDNPVESLSGLLGELDNDNDNDEKE